jgi:putative transposase
MNNDTVMLKEGMRVNWAGQQASIYLATNELFVFKYTNGAFQNFTPLSVHDAYFNGTLKLIEAEPNPVILRRIKNEEELKKLEMLGDYLRLLDNEKYPASVESREKIIKILENKYLKKMSLSSLYRYYREWLQGGRNILIFSKNIRHQRTSKFSGDMLDIVDDIIHEFYLIKNGLSISACYTKLEERCLIRNIKEKPVSRSQFYEFCNSIDEIEMTIARKGREAARVRYQNAVEVIWADYPLQYVEVDAVHLNIGIIHPETGEYLGTIIIYVSIDRFSRCIIGFSTSIKASKKGEQTESVIECAQNSIMPKPDFEFCTNKWISYGVPNYFVFDAGSAFNNDSVLAYTLQVGSNRIITQTKTPKKKPFIERFFRTLRQQFAKRIPGYLGKRTDDEAIDATVKQQAVAYQHEIEDAFRVFVCDFYHQSSHIGLGNRTPHEVWTEFYKNTGIPPRMPSNPEAIRAFIGSNEEATLCSKNGIKKNKLLYNNTELRDLYYELKRTGNRDEKINFLYNKNDISKIYVINPNSMEMFRVPCTDKRIQPLTSLLDHKSKSKAATNSPKTYMSGDEPLFDNMKKRHNTKKPARRSKKPQPRTETEALTESQLDDIFMHGRTRTMAQVDEADSPPGDDNCFLNVSGLDDLECE